MNVILYDINNIRENLLPLTFTRPIADIRFGILTIKEKWQRYIAADQYSYITADFLAPKFPTIADPNGDNLFIAGNIYPSESLVAAINALPADSALTFNDQVIAYRGTHECFNAGNYAEKTAYNNDNLLAINWLYDIFMLDGRALNEDFDLITAGRESAPLSNTCTVIGDPSRIFLEEGATVEAANLNTKGGPIYVGHNAEIMEGACIRGALALCEHAYINMGTNVYGATTIGPYCKVGGELNNVVMIGYSNKAHDGFLGNAVIGEWCNLGADCVASNLKNDYSEIKLWNYPAHRFLRTGLQFCGLIMGDHSKAGINTMFNTATVVGVGCNIHGSGFPRNFIASFSEGGGASGFTDVSLKKFYEIAQRAMARRNIALTDTDIAIFDAIYDIAETYK